MIAKLNLIRFALLLITLAALVGWVLGQQPVASVISDDLKPYLKDYDVETNKIRAGFIPYKAQLVWGEPLQVTFTVENIGTNDFAFLFGGGYYNHVLFSIIVTDTNGKALIDPNANILHHGGSFGMGTVNLEPGKSFTHAISLTDFCVIDNPGIYTVNCGVSFGRLVQDGAINPIVNSTFKLTIVERTPERVSKVLDELVAKTQATHGHDLDDTVALIAHFGKDDALPRLAPLAGNGPVELRAAAICALPLIPTDASLDVVLASLKDPDPTIRAAAASSLGAMQMPRGVDALLDALPREKSPVAEAIVLALGTSKSARAFPAITNAFDTGGTELQKASVNALVNFGGSNAVAILQQHINTNYLSVRYEIVLALAEKLRQPMQAEWLLPVLMSRDYHNHWWYESLRLLRMYCGSNAIPTMLSCLDFDVAWSDRNHWILYEVKICPNAPVFDNYIWETDLGGSPYWPNGTPEMWTNNLRTLQKLKALAGPILVVKPSPRYPPVKYLKTDPPIDFTPIFQETGPGFIEIKSGFLDLKMSRTSGGTRPYSVSDAFRSIYKESARLRSLPNASSNALANLNISQAQMKQFTQLLTNFATRLCGNEISDQRTSNLYNDLVHGSEYCPSDISWSAILRAYDEAPAGEIKQQAKEDFMNSVQVFSQNYHAGTVEFVEAAKKIFTPAQLVEILK